MTKAELLNRLSDIDWDDKRLWRKLRVPLISPYTPEFLLVFINIVK